MSDSSEQKVEALSTTSIYFRLDDDLRVMPVHNNNLLDQISEVMEYRWGYQSKIGKDLLVSSTFLGIDPGAVQHHSHKPRVFETMIFRDGGSAECYRFHAIEDCIDAHHEIVRELSKE